MFQHEGSRTDKHVREHEVYSVGGAPAARRVAETASRIPSVSAVAAWFGGGGLFGLRRSALVAAPALFLTLLGGGVALGAMFDGDTAGASGELSTTQQQASSTPRPSAPPLRNLGAIASTNTAVAPSEAGRSPAPLKKIIERRLAEKKMEKIAAARTDPAGPGKPAAGEAGRLELAIAPWGTVFVDGHERGASPPLRVLDIAPGSHTIVIHNGDFAPYVERVVVKSGEATRVRHRFR
jgi:hypothetical protein